MTVACGERVELRYPLPNDVDEFIALRSASRERLALWEPERAAFDAFAEFTSLLANAATERHHKLLIVRSSDRRIAGYMAINEIVRGAFQSAYLGYWVGTGFDGRGYGTEALRLCATYAFTVLELHRLEANIIPSNAASRALARRCGLTKEGYSPRYLNIAGRWQDHERWAITREAWDNARAVG